MRKNGFTLIELIIVIVIGIFIFSVVLSALGGLSQSDHNSRKLHDLTSARDAIIRELENGIKWAGEVKVNPNNIQVDSGPDKFNYHVQNGILIKQNGPDKIDLTTDKVFVEDLQINDYSASPGFVLLEVKIKLSHTNTVPDKIETEFSTIIAQRKTKI